MAPLLEDLPPEILFNICTRCGVVASCKLAMASKRFAQFMRTYRRALFLEFIQSRLLARGHNKDLVALILAKFNEEDSSSSLMSRIAENILRYAFLIDSDGEDECNEYFYNSSNSLEGSCVVVQREASSVVAAYLVDVKRKSKTRTSFSLDLLGENNLTVDAISETLQLHDLTYGRVAAKTAALPRADGDSTILLLSRYHRKLFTGHYGPHGLELLYMECVRDETAPNRHRYFFYGRKVLGDRNVPSGKLSFECIVHLDGEEELVEYRNNLFDDDVVVRAFRGRGHIAQDGYRVPQTVAGIALFLRSGRLCFHWLTLHSSIVFTPLDLSAYAAK